MTRHGDNRQPSTADESVLARVTRADVLLVGLSDDDARAVPQRLLGALSQRTVRVPFSDLELLDLKDAVAVLSPVVTAAFDAIDVAGRLQQQGFRGNYIAFATDIPHEEMIREEIASVAPGIALTIVPMGHGPRLADC